MKKLRVFFILAAILVMTGCASSGGSSKGAGGGGGDLEPYSVNLNTLDMVRNTDPFKNKYDNLVILFKELPDNITKYQRITIKAKYFNEDKEEIAQGDDNAMVSVFFDVSGDIFSDGSPNLALKEFNLGGYSGQASTDRGSRVRLTKAPAGILLQNSNTTVKYIELTEVIFHN